MPIPLTFIKHNIGSPSHSNKTRKLNKRFQIGNEDIKQLLFADDMTLYIENPKDTTKKLLEPINKFGKFSGYKINIQKSVAFLYTNNRPSEREIKKTITFTVASERIKYLGRNLTKAIKDLYSENYKILIKEIEVDTNKWKKYTMLMDWKNYNCINDHTTQGNLQIQCTPHQNTKGIFHRTRTNNSNICTEIRKTPKYPKKEQN